MVPTPGYFVAFIFLLFFLNEEETAKTYPLSYTTLFRSDPARRDLLGDPRAWGIDRRFDPADEDAHPDRDDRRSDRKSTRLNSSHTVISYAVFCLKKKIMIS